MQNAALRPRLAWREALLGFLFVLPATILTFTFGLFPVAYGFFISMQDGTILPVGFVGFRNYFTALGSLAYIVVLGIALALAIGAYAAFRRSYSAMQRGDGNFYLYLFPGMAAALAFFGLLGLLFTGYLLEFGIFPLILLIVAIGGYVYLEFRQRSPIIYVVNSWLTMFLIFIAIILVIYTFAQLDSLITPYLEALSQVVSYRKYIVPLDMQFIALLGAAISAGGAITTHSIIQKISREEHPGQAGWFSLLRALFVVISILFIIFILGALNLFQGTLAAFAGVSAQKLATVTSLKSAAFLAELTVWPDVFSILLGAALICLAFGIWSRAMRRESTLGMVASIGIALLLMIGGWLVIGELPQAAAGGDQAFYNSLLRTVTYAALTVPTQLTLGLLLAYLLFFEVKRGKSLYRIIFFIPYIAPAVATASVFTVIFSLRGSSPANQLAHLFGIPQQEWLRSTQGVFQIVAQLVGGSQTQLPDFLVGPSLPLMCAIIYTIWVFSGYDSVIFLAGLGGIPLELTEAAQVDGGGRWAIFRNIIFPLLSPTTFFLTLIAIIGTFKAFDSIFVLRDPGSRGAMDTASLYIYDKVQNDVHRPYAAAMAIIIFGIIVILTLIQNRVARDQVFYV